MDNYTIYLIRFVEDSDAQLVSNVVDPDGSPSYNEIPCTILQRYELPIDVNKLQADLRLYCPAVARPTRRSGPRRHTDHVGNEFPTLAKMCEFYNIKESLYRSRVNKGWTLEEALTGERKDENDVGVVDHLGNHYKNVSEMCRAYGVRPDNFCQRRKRGWSLEETLKGKRSTEVTDHLGNTFPDVNAMCEHYGVKRTTYNQRLRNGATMEQALSSGRHTSGERQGMSCTDHLGNTYPSQRSMCRHYGIKVAAFRARLRNGYSLEEALTAVRGHHRERTNATVEDFKGNKYTSVKKMCEAYGVNQGTYYSRRNKGLTMEQALSTASLHHQGRPTLEVKDHLGNKYPSVKAMCEAYDLNYCTFRQRMSAGSTLQQALTAPHGRKGGVARDHLGNHYTTVREMCETYGVNYCTFRSRLRNGATLEEALTSKPSDEKILAAEAAEIPPTSGPCTDHLGNHYNNPTEMAQAYGLTKDQYLARVRFGWDTKSILTTPLRTSGRRKSITYKGKEYASRKELCNDVGINYNSFIIRLSNGIPLDEAVEIGIHGAAVVHQRPPVQDHLGNEYPTVTAMCSAYGISPTVYQYRLNHGKSQEEALTTPLKPRGDRRSAAAAPAEAPAAAPAEAPESPAEEA